LHLLFPPPSPRFPYTTLFRSVLFVRGRPTARICPVVGPSVFSEEFGTRPVPSSGGAAERDASESSWPGLSSEAAGTGCSASAGGHGVKGMICGSRARSRSSCSDLRRSALRRASFRFLARSARQVRQAWASGVAIGQVTLAERDSACHK